MQYFIIKLLDLKEEDMDSIHTVFKINQADFLITLKVKDHVCPQCGCFTRYVKDYRTRKLKHLVLVNFSSTIFYRQRRYLCRNCQKSFVEKSPFTRNRHTITPATVINIFNDLKPYNSTYSSVAKKYNVSVTTVIDMYSSYIQICHLFFQNATVCINPFRAKKKSHRYSQHGPKKNHANIL